MLLLQEAGFSHVPVFVACMMEALTAKAVCAMLFVPCCAMLCMMLRMQEADFFYVPVYAACMMEAVAGWADAPWWHSYRWVACHDCIVCPAAP
jgi:hypothetical protein